MVTHTRVYCHNHKKMPRGAVVVRESKVVVVPINRKMLEAQDIGILNSMDIILLHAILGN